MFHLHSIDCERGTVSATAKIWMIDPFQNNKSKRGGKNNAAANAASEPKPNVRKIFEQCASDLGVSHNMMFCVVCCVAIMLCCVGLCCVVLRCVALRCVVLCVVLCCVVLCCVGVLCVVWCVLCVCLCCAGLCIYGRR
jgi:hypothetical protein